MKKQPTYSVFVKFRDRQRLTLKRSAPLDVALRFASDLRGERFHNPDDIFVLDDATGEPIVEPVPGSDAAGDAAALLGEVVDIWQIRYARQTFRSGQQLTQVMEQSLAQLTRLMQHLRRWKLCDEDIEGILGDADQAIEQVRKVRDAMRHAEMKLRTERAAPAAAPAPPPAPPPDAAPDTPPKPKAPKRPRKKN